MLVCAILEKSRLPSYRNLHLWPDPQYTHPSKYASVDDGKLKNVSWVSSARAGLHLLEREPRQAARPAQPGVTLLSAPQGVR